MQVYFDSDSDEEARVMPFLPMFQSKCMGTCSVCLETLEPGFMIELPCKHFFHTLCIKQWFEVAYTCPVCRSEY